MTASLPNDPVIEALKNMTPEEIARFMEAAGLNEEAIGKTISLEEILKDLEEKDGDTR